MTNGTKVSLGLAGLVLLAGLALVVVGSRPPPERTFKGNVKDLLPKPEEIPGWTVEYLPIADTPEMKAKVSELLNYDDALFAVYTKGPERLSVYIAYWAPGKMSHRLVAGHTPDVCWVRAGWDIVEAKTWEPALGDRKAASGPLAQVLDRITPLMQATAYRRPTTIKAENLPPAEYRVMHKGDRTENVAFWHILDGAAKSYGTRGSPPWHAMFTDLFSRSLDQQPEQFFIRISADKLL
ncbi:hypothetical protein Verru16b_02991 [Lacunisphaera limnophila]|uniref:Methanolan biosynthesis EpsI domain-containing protein n=1 Tax=Lacunisphaera limnophila TaxID=1838286 RepID=A0A1D8AYD2_9BACT|nr:exosortase-associated EpsI family protein [Lacunisphaera limnophila]AOS45900.1 hypothetical protein Verru16b_02991 [Lacunisphaera limnophila]